MTFDSDFYDITVISGHPPKVIWIRTGNLTTNEIVQLLIRKKDAITIFISGEEFEEISCLEID